MKLNKMRQSSEKLLRFQNPNSKIRIKFLISPRHPRGHSSFVIRVSSFCFCFLFSIFCLLSSVFCEFKAPTHLIDTPTAYLSGVPFAIGINASFTTNEDPFPRDENAYIELEVLKRATLGLSILTRDIMPLEFKFRISEEAKYIPAIAAGCMYISPYEWICPVGVGRDVGWDDDQTYDYKRTSERCSVFIVATKDFGPYGILNLGIGNGRFVGYGPRSHLFNSDMFSGRYHRNAIGMIWGGEILLWSPVFGVIDFDGRDFNVGLKIRNEYVQLGLSASKLEHRLKGSFWLYPRFAIGVTVSSSLLRRWIQPPMGRLTVVVTDARSGAPRRATISFPGSSAPSTQTDGETGTCTIKLEPGTYWVRAGILGYYWAEKKVYVAPGMSTICYFEIYSLIP